MPQPSLSSPVTSRQARLLLDPELYGLLQLLMRAEVTAAEGARVLGWSLQRTHHQLGRLVEAGIAEVARQEKRAGRPVKHYVSVQPEWFVPFEVTGAETLAEMLIAQLEPRLRRMYDLIAERLLRHARTHRMRLSLEGGILALQMDRSHWAAPELLENQLLFAQVSNLRLDAAQAKQFRERLLNLVSEFLTDEPSSHLMAVLLVEGEGFT